jgi:hypothetical protein
MLGRFVGLAAFREKAAPEGKGPYLPANVAPWLTGRPERISKSGTSGSPNRIRTLDLLVYIEAQLAGLVCLQLPVFQYGAESSEQTLPATDDVVYFELPRALKLQSLRAEVHLYVFATLPSSPVEALGQLGSARASFWCKTIGIEDDRGGRELRAAWQITGARPELRRAPRPFRPNPGIDMQQIRVKVAGTVFGDFEYLFERGKATFEPLFDRETELRLGPEFGERSEALKVVPPEHLPWFRVTGLQRTAEPTSEDAYHAALRKLSPGEGAFVLVSVRRRERAK